MLKAIANRLTADRILVYAYIPKYRCLEDVNLNFSLSYKLSYDTATKVLRCTQCAMPKNFLPMAISSIAAIVGKNGNGKSSALRWLLDRVVEGSAIEKLDGILVFLKNNKLEIYHDVEISGISVEGNIDYEPINTKEIDIVGLRHLLSVPTIYSSGHFDIYHEMSPVDTELLGERNISDRCLFIKDIENFENLDTLNFNAPIGEHMLAYSIQNDLRICQLLLDPHFQKLYSNQHGKPGIHLPRYIVFRPNSSGDRNITRRLEYLRKELDKVEPEFRSGNPIKFQYKFLKNVRGVAENPNLVAEGERHRNSISKFIHCALLNFYYSISSVDFIEHQELETALKWFTEDYRNTNLNFKDWIDHICLICENELGKKSRPRAGRVDTISSYHRSFSFFLEFFQEFKKAMTFLYDRLYWITGIPIIDCTEIIKDTDYKPTGKPNLYADTFPIFRENIGNLMKSKAFTTERFFDLSYSHDYHSPTAVLSSGELAMLNLYSRLKYAYETPMPGGVYHKPTLVILDEVELSFHPEWQRRFIFNLMQFLSDLAGANNIQIIYTTHSPITLSDMPLSGVNLLASQDNYSHNLPDDKRFETFGANVFDLYGNSFFMERGLIGEFARYKIEQLSADIEKLDEYNPEISGMSKTNWIKDIKLRIEMIGDKRIRQYLMSRLETKVPELEIARLKERLRELEAEEQ